MSHIGRRKKPRVHKLPRLLTAMMLAVGGFALSVSISGSASAADPDYALVTGHAAFSSDANNPNYWGDNCTKIEEPGGTSYVLPEGTYDEVIVKAGAGDYANTIFADPPTAGQTVWADTNGNNTYDPGGQDGDKDISHVILCKDTPPPPVDVCPNIEGDQATVPPGLVKDDAGNCVQPPTDVCPNIPGNQAEVPPGMVLHDGQCITLGPPPEGDVCDNLPGVQQVVPQGYVSDGHGNCIKPVIPPPHPKPDVCSNIAGIQSVVPTGLVLKDGKCINKPKVADTGYESSSPWLPIGGGVALLSLLLLARHGLRRGNEA